MVGLISKNCIDSRLPLQGKRGNDSIKVVFFGTPDFVVPIPQRLLEMENCKLIAVVTAPDRPVGRKQVLTPTPVKKWALENKISVLTPEKLDQNFLNILISQYPNIDLFIVAAYGKILPPEILKIPKLGCLCIHPSLLPKYRGASPVQGAIISGNNKTGVSIILMDEKMDHGPIISQFEEPIYPNDTAESLYFRLFQKAADALTTIIPDWTGGRIKPREQEHQKATFTHLLKKEDGFIPWPYLTAAMKGETLKESWTIRFLNLPLAASPSILECFIRAMSPWPGAYTNVKLNLPAGKAGIKNEKLEKRLKLLKAHLVSIQDRQPIPILDRKVATKLVLVLDIVQLEGKKPVPWEQFHKAYPEIKF